MSETMRVGTDGSRYQVWLAAKWPNRQSHCCTGVRSAFLPSVTSRHFPLAPLTSFGVGEVVDRQGEAQLGPVMSEDEGQLDGGDQRLRQCRLMTSVRS